MQIDSHLSEVQGEGDPCSLQKTQEWAARRPRVHSASGELVSESTKANRQTGKARRNEITHCQTCVRYFRCLFHDTLVEHFRY